MLTPTNKPHRDLQGIQGLTAALVFLAGAPYAWSECARSKGKFLEDVASQNRWRRDCLHGITPVTATPL
jgi:hypothetical protein